jgi:hypothetical protein
MIQYLRFWDKNSSFRENVVDLIIDNGVLIFFSFFAVYYFGAGDVFGSISIALLVDLFVFTSSLKFRFRITNMVACMPVLFCLYSLPEYYTELSTLAPLLGIAGMFVGIFVVLFIHFIHFFIIIPMRHKIMRKHN